MHVDLDHVISNTYSMERINALLSESNEILGYANKLAMAGYPRICDHGSCSERNGGTMMLQ